MKVVKIGLHVTHHEKFYIRRPTGSGDYLLLLIRTPSIITLEGQDIAVQKDSVILFQKNSPQNYRADGPNYINDYLHFDTDNIDAFRTLEFNRIYQLSTMVVMDKLMREIYLEFMSKNQHKETSMELLIKLLFVKLKEVLEYKSKDSYLFSYYDSLVNLRFCIYENPDKKWTIGEMAKIVNVSISHFQRLYKSTFEISCIADVIASKMEYAKTSLTSTSCPVWQIAEMCGYDNEEHFMRQFKKEIGMTPSNYRKQVHT